MKLRVGGKYKTRGGDIVEIICSTGRKYYTFRASDGSTYTDEGYYFEKGDPQEQDIVEEVFEEDTQVIDSNVEVTSEDTKDVYIKILEAMLTQDQLDTAGRILGNLSGNTPKDLYEARLKQVVGDN